MKKDRGLDNAYAMILESTHISIPQNRSCKCCGTRVVHNNVADCWTCGSACHLVRQPQLNGRITDSCEKCGTELVVNGKANCYYCKEVTSLSD